MNTHDLELIRQYVRSTGQVSLFQMTGIWVRTGERQIAFYPLGGTDWFYTSVGTF